MIGGGRKAKCKGVFIVESSGDKYVGRELGHLYGLDIESKVDEV